MRRIRGTFTLLAAVMALLVLPGIAQASPQQVIRDCAQDGKLDHHYSLSDLKNALKKLPTDVDEYTNCRDVINQAEEQGSGGGNTPSDVQALNNAKGSGTAPSLSLHGEKITPGTGGVFKTAGAANDV